MYQNAKTRLREFLTPLRILEICAVLSVILITFWQMHPTYLFSTTAVTGGDMGSHFALSAYLHSTGNPFNLTPWYPGWFAGMPSYTYYFVLPDALAAIASYVINFSIAFKLATILGSILMPICAYTMGRLMKAPRPIPVALAMATLPFLFDASFTIDGGNLFSTMAGEYAFSLSLSLALLTIGLFYRGIKTGRGLWVAAIALSATLASHVLPWFFALGAIALLVVMEFISKATAKSSSRPLRFTIIAGIISFGFSAWWLLSFVTTQNLTNSMGYVNDSTATMRSIFTTLGWFNSAGGIGGDWWVIVLAAIGAVVAIFTWDRLGIFLTALSLVSLLAFVYDPQSVIWNERLIPFWYISIHLLTGWLFGYALYRWIEPRRLPGENSHFAKLLAKLSPSVTLATPAAPAAPVTPGPSIFARVITKLSPQVTLAPPTPATAQTDPAGSAPARVLKRTFRATLVILVIGALSVLPSLMPAVASTLGFNTTGNQVASWSGWNYSGYQAKPAWPEFHNIITTLDTVTAKHGCGRAMWEYNSNQNRFGTPEALMTIPYWTNNCVDSMEGLLFESSATTPYHFLNQAELSLQPSDPQVGLPYGSLDITEGVQHLQMLGVKYYIAYSPQAISQANADPSLTYLRSTRAWPSPGYTWRIYLVKNSPMVAPLKNLPNVVSNISARVPWLTANTQWYLDQKEWSVLATNTGPASWPRVSSITAMKKVPVTSSTKISNVKVGLQSISFHTSTIGVPVVVKISYFPRWHATGATGPYRASPNLMVVIPTSHDVSLVYGNAPVNTLGDTITEITIIAGLVAFVVLFRRRRALRRSDFQDDSPDDTSAPSTSPRSALANWSGLKTRVANALVTLKTDPSSTPQDPPVDKE
jgi:hypothetical protein